MVATASADSLFWKSAYEEHGRALLSFLQRRTRCLEDAEDLLQETFVQAMRSTEVLRDRSKVKSYLFTIANNLMLNKMRRSHKEIRLFENEDGTNPLEQFADSSSDTETILAQSELEGQISRILSDMPAAHRTAFELGIIQRLSYDEIVKATGWTLAQVKINVFRARKKAISSLRDDFVVMM